ncbi:protease inhibitor I42 family protein [Moheibacter lacus]|uniref:Protease inhibitor I42 family protein n=1 Tax=Moheibacter lacus TaxID=2745851 RepID=A0A838ZL34_9FLAO|nr:protease inhibitor I42 family protein [Moheibacter lacus]MBA5628206.1 protease inhibitor I42 family protein [Moheibacter lacus]
MKKLLLLSIASLAFMSCKTTVKERWDYFPDKVSLNEYNHLEFVKVKNGKTVVVNLEENPSTGYSWQTETQQECIVKMNDAGYQQNEAPEGMVGVPGVHTYEITGESSGVCLIEFKKFAPGEDQPEEKKAIYFIVE